MIGWITPPTHFSESCQQQEERKDAPTNSGRNLSSTSSAKRATTPSVRCCLGRDRVSSPRGVRTAA